ncbi:MAG: sensor histidine kinase, partial [Oscillospiraceae bacterium]
LDKVMIYGMEHWCYNEHGRLVSSERAFLHSSQYEYIRSFVPEVLEKGQIFVPTILLLDNREDEPNHVFGAIAGVVVKGPNNNRFVSILVRDFSDLDTTMITYVVLFTFMFLVAAFLFFTLFNKERDLNHMRRDLIANVSHELKTPITAIRAMAEALHDGMVKDPQTRRVYSGKIIEESDRLEQLVIDILELSKLQSSRTEFKKSITYADGIIPPVIDRYMMLCGDLGITLDTSGLNLKDVPPLHTDPEKLVTLMNILLDNAAKFTGESGTIWVTNQIHSKSVTFCIRDNGPGIRTEDVGRIFERFYKADVAHNSSGSGLGLAIADEIARGLGEKLWVESTFGIGTSFYFTVSCRPGG